LVNLVQGNENQEKPLEMFDTFEYGTLNESHVKHLAENLPEGGLQLELEWLAENTKFFSFKTHDNITLQGYYIPGDLHRKAQLKADGSVVNKEARDLHNASSAYLSEQCSQNVSQTIEPIVFIAGWTETTIKYAKFLHLLHKQGHDIFSFDIRGQGFSGSSKYSKTNGRKISHVDNFTDFVSDLQLFMDIVLPQQLHLHTNGVYNDTTKYAIVPSYVGFSLSGLIGEILHFIG
jgi:pimeloyl-ACP methyl ester carboxylesterase